MKFVKVKLKDLGTIVSGSTPSTKKPQNYDGDIPWITPKDLSSYDKIYISRGERNITEKGFSSCSTKMLPKGTILFSSRAPIGYIAIAKNELCTNQGFKSIIPNEKVYYLFLYYLIKCKKDYIAQFGSGTTFKEVSGNIMKEIEVEIPKNIQDQKKIAEILYKIDKKIELNNQINDNLQKYIKELYKEYFKDEKGTSTLKNIVDFSQGVQVPIEKQYTKLDNGLVRFIRIVDLTQGGKDNIRYIENKNRGIVNYDDIFMIRYGSPGIIGWNYEGIIANNLFKISPKDDRVTKNYLYCYFNNNEIQNYIRQNATSSTMPAINFSLLYDRVIIIPNKDKLQKFDSIVENVRIKELEIINENNTLEKLRDTLLPKLMNGEIDLDKIEI